MPQHHPFGRLRAGWQTAMTQPSLLPQGVDPRAACATSTTHPVTRTRPLLTLSIAATLLAGCGQGQDETNVSELTADLSSAYANSGVSTKTLTRPTDAEAIRLLNQASFGASDAAIAQVRSMGIPNWIQYQFTLPQYSYQTRFEAVRPPTASEGSYAYVPWETFWARALAGEDQLRARTVWALSQIFVISQVDTNLSGRPRGVSSYVDVLGRGAFGNFRTLLEEVSLHPMMGLYLTHLANRKEDAATGRTPDENYAREVMQLFTIGLYELNLDGTLKKGSNGQPISTYTNDDVMGLAKVFTGWSWAGADTSDSRFGGGNADPNRDVTPMQPYASWHSSSAKTFLGITIPAGTNARDSLRIALDRLFWHDNTAPFISKLLIQRMVTSNPSPAYVRRVAQKFINNGKGVRGDMKAVLQAILLDPEARDVTRVTDPSWGKLREPVLRLAALSRAYDAYSKSGTYPLRNLNDPASQLGQQFMLSPSVFNFYRPGYVPPGSQLSKINKVAPEMQIVTETSAAGYANFIRTVINSQGLGSATGVTGSDTVLDFRDEVALAHDPVKLVDRVALIITGDTMSQRNRALIRDAVSTITMSTSNPGGSRLQRAQLAIFLATVSPEFLVQK